MINVIKYLLSIFVMLSPIFNLKAQNLNIDLREVNLAYKNARSISADVEVLVYSRNDVTNTRVFLGRFFKSGLNYYSGIMDVFYLKNARCSIILDKNLRYVQYAGTKKTLAGPSTLPDFESQVDSLQKQIKSFNLISKSSRSISYRAFLLDKSIVEYIDITISLPGYTLGELVYYYQKDFETERVSVKYKNVTLNEVIPEGDFSEYKFIKYVNGKIVPAEPYKNYRLIIK